MSETILQTRGITKKYGAFAAVDDIDFEVNRGDIYGLVGKNGAGKTTLLKMICGLTVPTSGTLALFSQTSQKSQNAMRTRTGSIIETPSFLPYLSAQRNLEYYRIQRGITNKACVCEALEFVGLADTGKKKFKSFSLGMKQRLGLALAIMNNPDLLILDEPINGLDPMGIAEFREIILKLNREKNTTIIISSHILGELSQIANIYGFINEGKLVEHITSSDLEQKCKVCIKLKVLDVQQAANVIKTKLGCDNYQIMNEHELQVGEFLDTPELLTKALVENSVMVQEIMQSRLNLEKYFIGLVGGSSNV